MSRQRPQIRGEPLGINVVGTVEERVRRKLAQPSRD